MITRIRQLDERIDLFRQFHQGTNQRPLIGMCIGGWEGFQRYVKHTLDFLPKGPVSIHQVTPDAFESMYDNYTAKLAYPDDLIRSVEPVPSIPWSEAAAGCPIAYTGTNFWAANMGDTIGAVSMPGIQDNPWLHKYREFLVYLQEKYGTRYPISQAILRGPLDMLAAVVGDQNMIYAFYDSPGEAVNLMEGYTEIIKAFLRLQNENTPLYQEGRVVGQYHIWTPGSTARLQQDAQSLLSPDLYEQYMLPFDRALCAVNEFNLFHMHASAYHLLDLMLSVERISIMQISKDEGIDNISDILPGLIKIQKANRRLVLKGRFTKQDLEIIDKKLDYRGLCLQFVVETADEADAVLSSLQEKLHR